MCPEYFMYNMVTEWEEGLLYNIKPLVRAHARQTQSTDRFNYWNYNTLQLACARQTKRRTPHTQVV